MTGRVEVLGEPFFIQVSNERGIAFLERFEFHEPVNVYTKRRDKTDAWLIRIGLDDGRGYEGHRYIVRCMTGPLLGRAEEIVRRKLGMAPRVVAG